MHHKWFHKIRPCTKYLQHCQVVNTLSESPDRTSPASVGTHLYLCILFFHKACAYCLQSVVLLQTHLASIWHLSRPLHQPNCPTRPGICTCIFFCPYLFSWGCYTWIFLPYLRWWQPTRSFLLAWRFPSTCILTRLADISSCRSSSKAKSPS